MTLFIKFDENGKTAKKRGSSKAKKSTNKGKSSSKSGRKWLPREEWLKQQQAKKEAGK